MVSAKYLITGVCAVFAVYATPVPQDSSSTEVAAPVDDTPVEAEDPSMPSISKPTTGPLPSDDSEAGSVAPLEKRCFLGLCKLFGGGSSSMTSNTSSSTCSTCSTQCTQSSMTCAMLKVKRAILG